MFEFVADKLEELNYPPVSHSVSNKNKSEIGNPGEFISAFVDQNSDRTKLFESKTIIKEAPKEDIDNFVCMKRINDVHHLRNFFYSINKTLPLYGKFICFAETKEQRFFRIVNKFPKYISYPYYVLDFILKRLFPKWGPTRKIYFFLTKGNNRVMSMPEILGRFVYAGFKIDYLKEINNLTYFVTEKIQDSPKNSKTSYGFIFKMERVGKNGKKIHVYKLRTMHPYAEYLQKFMYDINKLKEGGKFNQDFRIAKWGVLLRKLWIDELPMLFNWLKGDLKLVGLRPLSTQYLNLYNNTLRERRLKYKPGLIPPFYTDLPRTFDEIMESEQKYLDAFDKKPIITDIKYFFLCFYNIFFKGARSS